MPLPAASGVRNRVAGRSPGKGLSPSSSFDIIESSDDGGGIHHSKSHHGGGGRRRSPKTNTVIVFIFAGAIGVCGLCLLGMWTSSESVKKVGKRLIREKEVDHDEWVDDKKAHNNEHQILQKKKKTRQRRPGGEEEEVFPIPKHDPSERRHSISSSKESIAYHEDKELQGVKKRNTRIHDRPSHVHDNNQKAKKHDNKVLHRHVVKRPMESPHDDDDDNDEEEGEGLKEQPTTIDDSNSKNDDDNRKDDRDDEGANSNKGGRQDQSKTTWDDGNINERPLTTIGGIRPRVLALDFQLLFPHDDENSNEYNSGGGKQQKKKRQFQPILGSYQNALLTRVYANPPLPSEPIDRYVTLYPDDDGYEERLISLAKATKGGNREVFEDDKCKAKHEWQLGAYPVCNTIHEHELSQLLRMFTRAARRFVPKKSNNVSSSRRPLRKIEGEGEEIIRPLSNGYWRDVWVLSKASGSFDTNLPNNDTSSSVETSFSEELTVLKTLRYEHEFNDRNYDRHRKDALASERLSKSPYVVDIYAYCANTAVFEYGKGGDIDGILWDWDEEEEKYRVNDIPSIEMLDLAYQVARAIADMHDVEDDGYASIAHTDITPSQFIFIDGHWKLNDFNRCRFMRVKREDDSPCGFYVAANPGKFRAPEEYEFKEESEMIDVYSMGIVFYSILTGNSPWEGEKESKAQKKVIAGKRPEIPDDVLESKDVAIQAILRATQRCWQQNPNDRPKAYVIRDDLRTVMDILKREQPNREP